MANVNNIEGMLGSMDLSNVEQKAVTLNVSKRLPAIMLVDTSGSMGSYEDLLKRSVEGLYEAILADRTASNSTELAVLTFNSDIEILERMREIKAQEAKGKNLDFHCHGCTLTGLALKNAIMQIEGRKKVYAKVVPKIKYYAPIIFLISDGVPECYDENVKPQEAEAMAFSKAYIKREVAANRLVVISVEVSDHCDHGANVRIRLMQQMAFFLSEADMENQISSLIRLLVNNGMGDDASFAVICNMKETGNVLSGLSPEFRRQLFDLQKDLSDKKMDNSKKLLAMIGSAPNGTTIGELTRNLHIHSKSITKKKLNHLLVMELIKQENGRIYIAD